MKRIMLKLLGTLVGGVALKLQLSTAIAQGAGFTLLATLTNPTPAAGDAFGYSVAALGSNRVLIGAYMDDAGASDSGAAYLFSTSGALLTTFTNPLPTVAAHFGVSVAGVGTDRVLIGADQGNVGAWLAGVAYLFSTNGTLLTIFTNPTPADGDRFGASLAAMGSDQVLIGAYLDRSVSSHAGTVYLFRTNGALLTTLTNPTPAAYDYFGWSIAAVGSHAILIGASGDDTSASDSGAAYLFSTNGTLLTTFTNPTPVANDQFGYSVAALGADRVLIGARYDNTGASYSGAAYLFGTNGVLLTTFAKPTPAALDYFGRSVAVVGTDWVLFGVPGDNTGAEDAGAAHLFNTAGTHLRILANPTPAYDDRFGFSVSAVGSDRVVIGAYFDDTSAVNAGAANLFSIQPALSSRLTTSNTVAISWPSPSTGWTLRENTNWVASVNWSNAPGTIQDDGTNRMFLVNPSAGNRFYRLFKP